MRPLNNACRRKARGEKARSIAVPYTQTIYVVRVGEATFEMELSYSYMLLRPFSWKLLSYSEIRK